VNFEKCNVGLRNQQLVRMAARYVGETTAKVYEALLRVLENQVIRCYDPLDPIARPPPSAKKEKKEGGRGKKDDEEDKDLGENMKRVIRDDHQPLIKVGEVANMLDPEIDLNNGLYGEELVPTTNGRADDGPDIGKENKGGPHPVRKRKPMDPTMRLLKIEQHLRILAVDPRQFVVLVGRDYRVPYNAITRNLINNTIEEYVTARYGMLSARVVRMLHASGNLDEGQLKDHSMVSDKDIRLAIIPLCQAGLLRMQEVPKDTTRQTNRIMWSVKYDVRRARRQLIKDSYQAMTRLLARLEVERTKVDMVIEKSERSDVIGHEDKYLSEPEKQKLHRWNEVEEMLLRQVYRMDDLVATMRDFSSMNGWVLPVWSHDEAPS
jgi:DNA-directed RNA polymerase III subunit RPC3